MSTSLLFSVLLIKDIVCTYCKERFQFFFSYHTFHFIWQKLATFNKLKWIWTSKIVIKKYVLPRFFVVYLTSFLNVFHSKGPLVRLFHSCICFKSKFYLPKLFSLFSFFKEKSLRLKLSKFLSHRSVTETSPCWVCYVS